MNKLGFLAYAAQFGPRLLQVRRGTWIGLGIGLVVLAGLFVWAAIALMGWFPGQAQGWFGSVKARWAQLSTVWWGEVEVKFYVDGEVESPTICGTGTEDNFGGAWGFEGATYSTPFLGYPLYRKEPGEVPRHGLYRWHVLDSIRFQRELKVTIQALGWWPNGKFQPLTDDIASVGYWYQAEPHAAFPRLPEVHERWSR